MTDLSRDETIKRIKAGLRARTGREWSVTGGRGTGWGWIRINAMPKAQDEYGSMTEADRDILREALGLDSLSLQGASIAAANDYYAEYVDRAEGRVPAALGQRYWD